MKKLSEKTDARLTKVRKKRGYKKYIDKTTFDFCSFLPIS